MEAKLDTLTWRKTGRSNDTGSNCVEIAVVDQARD
jgi:hypothetical protein